MNSLEEKILAELLNISNKLFLIDGRLTIIEQHISKVNGGKENAKRGYASKNEALFGQDRQDISGIEAGISSSEWRNPIEGKERGIARGPKKSS